MKENSLEKELAEYTRLVADIITRLSPVFEVDPKKDFPNFPYPSVIFGASHPYYACYVPRFDIPPAIFLPDEKGKRSEVVLAHEIGHWYHNMINPAAYKEFLEYDGLKRGFAYLFGQTIAFYTELHVVPGLNLRGLRFTLPQLTKMSMKEALAVKKELIEFWKQDIRPKVALEPESLDSLNL